MVAKDFWCRNQIINVDGSEVHYVLVDVLLRVNASVAQSDTYSYQPCRYQILSIHFLNSLTMNTQSDSKGRCEPLRGCIPNTHLEKDDTKRFSIVNYFVLR